MDIIRLVLLEQESDTELAALAAYDQALIAYNVALMVDAGLLHATVVKDTNGFPIGAGIVRPTWQGHEFLDAARDNGIWTYAKKQLLKPGISWTFSILVEFLKEEAKRKLGLALGSSA